jgi:uroporphyrinogen-III synthase
MDKPILLLTRPDDAAARFAGKLRPDLRASVDVILSPLLQIAPLADGNTAAPCEAAIFTSANGVQYGPSAEGRRAWCVGAETAALAAAQGWECLHAAPDAEALVSHLSRLRPEGQIVHFSGTHQRGDIAERLRAAGLRCSRVAVYDQSLIRLTPSARAALAGPRPVIAPLFSPRSASQFARQASAVQRVQIIAMSPAVAAALGTMGGGQVTVVPAPTAEVMVKAVEKAILRATFA